MEGTHFVHPQARQYQQYAPLAAHLILWPTLAFLFFTTIIPTRGSSRYIKEAHRQLYAHVLFMRSEGGTSASCETAASGDVRLKICPCRSADGTKAIHNTRIDWPYIPLLFEWQERSRALVALVHLPGGVVLSRWRMPAACRNSSRPWSNISTILRKVLTFLPPLPNIPHPDFVTASLRPNWHSPPNLRRCHARRCPALPACQCRSKRMKARLGWRARSQAAAASTFDLSIAKDRFRPVACSRLAGRPSDSCDHESVCVCESEGV